MPPLNLPRTQLRIMTEDNTVKVFDPLRNKYVVLTPEEYVRQHFVAWMINDLGYPASNMADEVGLRVNGTLKRCDTLVINRDGSPLMIVEYKAPGVNITQSVFDQIVRYNMELRARYLVVSNGLHHYCCVIDYEHDTYHFIPRVPDYRELMFGDNPN
ncbi:MAG: type I restriction enzyme HsdR N-terminal domain-containing protein [Muribaculum sp.]|nr:type I restriction enzyme HsdR N-terminal domain-containing protein [Muribaculum sp.]